VNETYGALQDFGPPIFNSIYFACGATKYATSAVNNITVTAAEQQAIVEGAPSTNVNINGTAAAAVTGTYLTGTGAAAVTAVDPATYNQPPTSGLAAFFVNATFLGAVGPAGSGYDTWFQKWTCNSNRANFGTTSGSCTALPN
jgi:hypothetical protein